jgi:hypothetical protein
MISDLPTDGVIAYYFDLPPLQQATITYDWAASDVVYGSVLSPLRSSNNTAVSASVSSLSYNSVKVMRYCSAMNDPTYQSTSVVEVAFQSTSSHSGPVQVASFESSTNEDCPAKQVVPVKGFVKVSDEFKMN